VTAPDAPACVEATILRLLAERDAQASICPSDVARALGDDEAAWRALMPAVRDAAARLVQARRIEVTQRQRTVRIEDAKGPVRLRRGERFDAP
jgi:hypothetical protein